MFGKRKTDARAQNAKRVELADRLERLGAVLTGLHYYGSTDFSIDGVRSDLRQAARMLRALDEKAGESGE